MKANHWTYNDRDFPKGWKLLTRVTPEIAAIAKEQLIWLAPGWLYHATVRGKPITFSFRVKNGRHSILAWELDPKSQYFQTAQAEAEGDFA